MILSVTYLPVKRYFHELLPGRIIAFLAIAVMSHTILDYFSVDTAEPYGVPLFWPLISEYNISSFPLFLDVKRSGASNIAFITSLFSTHNLVAMIGELIFGCTVVLTAILIRRRFSNLANIQLLIGAFFCSVLFLFYQFQLIVG
jgi:hypothetical protein